MFNINGLSDAVARERHLDFVREADRERRMNELVSSPSRLPTFVARLKAASRGTRERWQAIAGRDRRLRPVCQE